MTNKKREAMQPKHLFGHIFYTNMNDNFKFNFTFDRRSPVPIPEKFEANIPFNIIQDIDYKFKDKIVFIIGSGPSLNKNINQLKSLTEILPREEFIILSCDGSIWDLKELGIKPDYVISSEADGQHNRPNIPTTDQILDGGDLSWYADVPLIADTWCNKSWIERWPCKDIYYYVNHDIRYENFWDAHEFIFPALSQGQEWALIHPGCSCVGFHAIDICKFLKAKEAILLGFDMSATKNEHHSKNFNLNWQDTNMDLGKCYADHVMWFLSHYDGKFGFNVTNCTEGGVLNNKICDAKWSTLQNKLEDLRCEYGSVQS